MSDKTSISTGGSVDIASAKRAFALWPSGVTVVTTRDRNGAPQGFTASSFTPLSLDPLMVLVCIGRSARSFDAFMQADHIGLSILQGDQIDIAQRFASRETDKFAGFEFEQAPAGSLLVKDAAVAFEGSVQDRLPGGDHIVLTVGVEHLAVAKHGDVMTYFARGFGTLAIPAPQ